MSKIESTFKLDAHEALKELDKLIEKTKELEERLAHVAQLQSEQKNKNFTEEIEFTINSGEKVKTTLEQYLINMFGKNTTKKTISAIKSGIPVIIDGLQGPTGKSTLCKFLKDIGVQTIQKYEINEAEANCKNSVNVVITLNEKVI